MATIETGTVSLSSTIDDGIVESITFTESFDSTPAVVGYIPTAGGGQSIVHRFRNVTTTGCDVYTVEPDAQGHNTETVVWMAVETGSHDIDGVRVDAGIETTSVTHDAPDGAPSNSVSYPGTSFSSTPLILHSLNTNNNGEFMASGCSSRNTSSCNIYQEAAETSASRTTEDIGFVVVENVFADVMDGVDMDADTEQDGSSDGEDDTAHSLGFNRTFSTAPDIIVSGQTLNGNDGYWARGAGSEWSTTGHDVYAEEDQVVDTEQGHADEEFGYFAIEPNALLTSETIRNDTPVVETANVSTLTATEDVSASDGAITSANASSLTATDEGFINAPTALTASNPTTSTIDLSWDDNSGAETHYLLYRSTTSGSTLLDYDLADAALVNQTSLTDEKLASSTEYFYRARAVSGTTGSLSPEFDTSTATLSPKFWGDGTWQSDDWSRKIPDDSDRIVANWDSLSWDADKWDESVPFATFKTADNNPRLFYALDNADLYLIYRSTTSGKTTADYTLIDATENVTYTDTTVSTEDDTYYYRVEPLTVDRSSALSNEASATTLQPAATDAGVLTPIVSAETAVTEESLTFEPAGTEGAVASPEQPTTTTSSDDTPATTAATVTPSTSTEDVAVTDGGTITTSTVTPQTSVDTSSSDEANILTPAVVNTEDATGAIDTAKALTAVNLETAGAAVLTEGATTIAGEPGTVTDTFATPETINATTSADDTGLTPASATGITTASTGVSAGDATGLYFGGYQSNDGASVPNDASLNITGDITVAFRMTLPRDFDRPNENDWRGIVGKGGAFSQYDVLTEDQRVFSASVHLSDDTSTRNLNGNVPVGSQVTFTFTWDRSTGELTNYVDGSSVGTATGSSGVDIASDTGNFNIGNFGSEDLLAVMDHVRVDARKWSTSEITDYANGIGPDRTDARLILPLEEGSGSTINDISGNSNDGSHNTFYVPYTPYANPEPIDVTAQSSALDEAVRTASTVTPQTSVDDSTALDEGVLTAVTSSPQTIDPETIRNESGLQSVVASPETVTAETSAVETPVIEPAVVSPQTVNAETSAGDGGTITASVLSTLTFDAVTSSTDGVLSPTTMTTLSTDAVSSSIDEGITSAVALPQTSVDTALTLDEGATTPFVAFDFTGDTQTSALDEGIRQTATASPQTIDPETIRDESGLQSIVASPLVAVVETIREDAATLTPTTVNSKDAIGAIDTAKALTAINTETAKVSTITSDGTAIAADENPQVDTMVATPLSINADTSAVDVANRTAMTTQTFTSVDTGQSVEDNIRTPTVASPLTEDAERVALDEPVTTLTTATSLTSTDVGGQLDGGITDITTTTFQSVDQSSAVSDGVTARTVTPLSIDAETSAAETPTIEPISVTVLGESTSLAGDDASIAGISSTVFGVDGESLATDGTVTAEQIGTLSINADTLSEEANVVQAVPVTPVTVNAETSAGETPLVQPITATLLLPGEQADSIAKEPARLAEINSVQPQLEDEATARESPPRNVVDVTIQTPTTTSSAVDDTVTQDITSQPTTVNANTSAAETPTIETAVVSPQTTPSTATSTEAALILVDGTALDDASDGITNVEPVPRPILVTPVSATDDAISTDDGIVSLDGATILEKPSITITRRLTTVLGNAGTIAEVTDSEGKAIASDTASRTDIAGTGLFADDESVGKPKKSVSGPAEASGIIGTEVTLAEEIQQYIDVVVGTISDETTLATETPTLAPATFTTLVGTTVRTTSGIQPINVTTLSPDVTEFVAVFLVSVQATPLSPTAITFDAGVGRGSRASSDGATANSGSILNESGNNVGVDVRTVNEAGPLSTENDSGVSSDTTNDTGDN